MKIWKMKIKSMAVVPAVLAAAVVLIASPAWAAGGHIGFGFNARGISGAPTGGAVTLTGGGSYDPATGFVKSAGGFRCTSDVGGQQGLLLAGCLAGQGVRWDTAGLLASTGFTCTGEAEPTVVTDNRTVVLLADFYRAGDGNDESFTAKMIVSDHDFAPNIGGVQNVWIQGVGCATAMAVNFSGRPSS